MILLCPGELEGEEGGRGWGRGWREDIFFSVHLGKLEGRGRRMTEISLVSLVRSGELVAAVKDAKTTEGDSKVPRLLLGAVRQLKHSRLKPDPILNAALVQLAEEDGEMFNTSYIIDVSC